MQELNEKTFEKEVKQGASVVEFFTDWCTVCKQVEPILQTLSKTQAKVKFFKINAGQNQSLASRFSIMSVPTLLFIKDGKLVDQVVGFANQSQLKEKIAKRLS